MNTSRSMNAASPSARRVDRPGSNTPSYSDPNAALRDPILRDASAAPEEVIQSLVNGGVSVTDAELIALHKSQDDEVHEYLAQLDQLREHSERTGNFVKAQECVNKMRDVNLRQAKKLEERSKQANVDTKGRLKQEHQLELLTFSRMWEDKLSRYDDSANVILTDLKAKHTLDYREQEGILKVQLMNKRPRFSKRVCDYRAVLEKCVQQRKYLEAEDVKKKLQAQEKHELDIFDEQLAATFEKRITVLKTQYTNEVRAVEQKIKVGREELLKQRHADFDKLVKRHENVFRELDTETRLHVKKTQRYIRRQVSAMVHDPLKTGMDLRAVSTTLRDGQGKSFRSSASVSRAKTPPATSRNRSSLRTANVSLLDHSNQSSAGRSRFEW